MRHEYSLTQEQVAELADISYKHYQAIEGGKRSDIRISTLEKLAKAFGKEPCDLVK